MITARTIIRHFPDLSRSTAGEIEEAAQRNDAEAALNLFDTAIDGFGIEALSDGGWHGSYWQETAALYVNRGDTYDKTLLYDVEEGRLRCMAWGDFLEALERDRQR